MAENEDEQKSLLIRVKEKSEGKGKYVKGYMHKGTYAVAKVDHNVLIHVPKRIEKGKIHHRDSNISQNGRKT